MRKFIVFLILYIINVSRGNKTKDQKSYCLSIFDGKKEEKHLPFDNNGQFIICKEHEKRTCCKKSHSEAIAKLFFGLIAKSSLSNKCSTFYQKLMCSFCDAEVGVGNKIQHKSPIICQSYCNMWYNACFEEYFDNIHNSYIRNNEEISFIRFNLIPCTDSSVICSPLYSITNSPQEFCSLNGFTTYSDYDNHSNEYNHNCFNGIPASSILKPGIKQNNNYQQMKYRPRNEIYPTHLFSLRNYIDKFLKRINIPLPALIFTILIITWSINRLVTFFL